MTEKSYMKARSINGDGSGQVLEGQAVSDMIKDSALAWVHLDGNAPESREWLDKEVTYLDHIIIDALLADETRPRILEFDNGILMILRGVNLNEDEEPEDMISIRIWIDPNRIITVGRRPLKAIQDIQEKLDNNKGPANAGDFIVMLAGRLFERMGPTFTELDDRLDDIEEQILENPDPSERREINNIRRQAIIFRRYITPQRDVIMALRRTEQSWLTDIHKRHLQESLERLIRYIEDLDSIRERGQIVKDELSNMLADRMNKTMYVLSVIAAIFLPLGFLTGLLGINVGGIPGAENADAFMIFCGMLAAIVVAQIAIFKALKWF